MAEGTHSLPISDDDLIRNETRIVLIGRTGAGKSTTGNSILGTKHFKSFAGAKSGTKQCASGTAQRDEKYILVVDTPGFFDTEMSNQEVMQEIVKCIGMSSPGPHAFILVVSVGRFTKEEQETVDLFVSIFGEKIWNYVIVLFTREDDLQEDGLSFDEFLTDRVPQDLKSILLQTGNRCLAFNNRADDSTKKKQVEKLLSLIQAMVQKNAESFYTDEMYKDAEKKIQSEMKEKSMGRNDVRKEINQNNNVLLNALWRGVQGSFVMAVDGGTAYGNVGAIIGAAVGFFLGVFNLFPEHAEY